jgi:predicted AAA+ superfamily ATPase
VVAEELAKAFVSFRFRFKDEKELQYGVAKALEILAQPYVPEFHLNATDRLDFYLAQEQIAIEIKIKYSLAVVTRQLWRYAKDDKIKALILITTRSNHLDMPKEILGKPLFVVYLNAML